MSTSLLLRQVAVLILFSTLSDIRAAPLPSDSPSVFTSYSTITAQAFQATSTFLTASPTYITGDQTFATATTTTAPELNAQWAPSPTMLTASPTPTIWAENSNPFLFETDGTTDTITIAPSSTLGYWEASPTFSDMSTFSVSAYAAGATNLAILSGSPGKIDPNAPLSSAVSNSSSEAAANSPWDETSNSLQIFYPQGSINPGNSPQGGSEFYAQPLDLKAATNASLEYRVYFPADFDFVKGGKLPGLYGGHKGCSGGNAAVDCFSTRMMWRPDGIGELYLYAPKDKQSPALCKTPPKSVCDSEYGLSIGRGAWTFAKGDWTTIRQDVWLNTPGLNDGGFNIWINGQLLLSASDVLYREHAATCLNATSGEDGPTVAAASVDPSSPLIDEDWQPQVSGAMTAGDLAMSSSSITNSQISSLAVATLSTTMSSTFSATAQSSGTATSATESFASFSSSTVTPSPAPTGYPVTPITPRKLPKPSFKKIYGAAKRQTTYDPMQDPLLVDAFNQDLGYGVSLPSASSQQPSSISTHVLALPTSAVVLDVPTVKVVSAPGTATPAPSTCSIGFIGLFFSTFFGGHTDDWASPKDQYTYFRDFKMWVNA